MNSRQTPAGMVLHTFEKEFSYSPTKLDRTWRKLQLRETFTRGQLFPYRVEFDSGHRDGEFFKGELNIHHGPLLSVHGAIGDITDSYRGLDYFYGSYVLSFRLIRPVKLEFLRSNDRLKVKLTVFIRPWLIPIWTGANWFLWTSFRYSI